ncbi:MAG: AEC family transporter [Gammaproteobacteria bacterium]|nr:AEC family transporter [Gammaproteobacteria bacterium]
MDLVLNVSFPVFGLILCGYLAARLGVLGQQSTQALNGFVYYFALPALLFVFVARAPVDRIFYWPFLAAFGGGYAITFGVSWLLFRKLYAERLAARAMRTSNGVFANTGYMGIPLASTAFGDAAVLPAIMATVFVSVVMLNVAIALIELDVAREAGGSRILRDVGLSMVKNPIVIPVALATVFPLAGWTLPAPVAKFCDLLGSAAGPCALFALGMFVATQSLRAGVGEAGLISFFKLIVQPFVTWLLVTYVFELEPIWAVTTVLVSALPMGATCFVLAQRYEVLVNRTSSATVLSTALSVITVTLLLAWLGPSVP